MRSILKPKRMKGKPIKWLSILFCLVLATIYLTNPALAKVPSEKLSSNIPLNSNIYTYLEKLDGLGVVTAMLSGTKPYTRMQVAGWVKNIQEQVAVGNDLSKYSQTLLEQLTVELAPELAVLSGESLYKIGIALRELKIATSGYDGESVSYQRTRSIYQPMVINQNGYHLAEGLNGTISANIEAVAGDYLLLNLEPRFGPAEEEANLSLESGYFKTHYKNLEIQLGKDALWWGPGERGNLGLTNNASAFTALQLSNLEPIRPKGMLKFLKQMDITAFYADLEDNRNDVKSPGFFGFRTNVTPGNNFTIAGTLTAMVGGEGHELHWGDLGNFITGKNALTAAGDKWNTIAGFDFRWRIPQLRGLQLYGELYGEDQAGKIPFPSKNSYVAGVYLPRLTRDGRWELKLETGKTIDCTYNHWLYTDGYTFRGNLIGDAMGNNAERYYMKLARYLPGGAWMAFHAERLVTEQSVSTPQGVDTFWITYHARLKADLTLDATLGLADTSNFNRQVGNSQRNYLGSITCTKRF